MTGQLRDILWIFNDATLYFSRDTPNLPMVIPAMDIINENLTDKSLEGCYKPCIYAAIGLAKKTLNWYYNKTNHSNVYWIAMAKKLVHNEYEHRVAAHLALNTNGAEAAPAPHKPSANMFDNLLNKNISQAPNERSELTRYLATQTEHVHDALAWWYVHCTEFLHLLWMAMSYLTIPATSVDVKWLFSMGHLLLPHIHNGPLVHDILAVVSGPEGEGQDEGLAEG
ncbi:hypothetical protein SCP_0604030 [Sparassis crispa]|uniref:HAT C-terminal dimerisation domain-containing protein n=1 Tax=Sparassis crispa TaxID=139825 RepID=A0A401GRS0_9APHY|nr:hypothetical protein SCP_0604030 [Sparassis crispa]GBE84424.1 hypothetical protein SCP_0604030 [Sparassis crispa]